MRMIKQIDRFASERLKQRRIASGLSQKELSEALDINVIQIKKYEDGVSSIPISRLYVLAKILNTPLKHFFNNSAPEEKSNTDNNIPGNEIEYSFKEIDKHLSHNFAEESAEYQHSIPIDREELTRTIEREILSLTRAFTKIQNPNVRKIIIELVRSLATCI